MNGNDTSTPGGSRKNPAITRLELRLEWWSFSVPSRVGLSDDAGKDRTRRLAFHVCRGIDRLWPGDGDERHRSARRLRGRHEIAPVSVPGHRADRRKNGRAACREQGGQNG